MSKEKPITLRSFASLDDAQELVVLLKENDIYAEIAKDSGGNLDKSFEGETMLQGFEVVISPEDKTFVEKILREKAEQLMADIPTDYYLFQFSEDELIDVIVKNNEWSAFDVALSQKILSDRGIDLKSLNISEKREARIEELSEPEGGQTFWIILGYLFALLGGFFGLLIGYFLWKTMRKIPDGTKVHNYHETVRSHGKNIFFISLVIFPIAVFLRVAQDAQLINLW
ncbi:MAG: hypothetical protein ACI865_003310 [Flavobacteriaceae bacterium]|jgi:hypothetical protein